MIGAHLRKFWQDAMDELIRPQIDVKLNFSKGGSSAQTYNSSWRQSNTSALPQNIGGKCYAYANQLNGNGFRLGDARCLLNTDSGQYLTIFPNNSASESIVSDGTEQVLCLITPSISANGRTAFKFLFWNLKDIDLKIEALDAVDLTANVIDTAYVNVHLDNYVEEYIADVDYKTLFPSWDSTTYKAMKVSYTIPSGDRLLLCGCFSPSDFYFTFETADIVKIEYNQEVDLLSLSVPSQEMRVTIYDENSIFDPTNPDGYYDDFVNGMQLNHFIGVEGAYLRTLTLYSTSEVSYAKHQLTIDFNTELQTDTTTDYIQGLSNSAVADTDLAEKDAWNGNWYLSHNIKTTAGMAERTWQGELKQLMANSVGAMMLYNKTYYPTQELFAMPINDIPNPSFYYKISARDLKDTYATIDKKPLLGTIKIAKYRYYVSSEIRHTTVTANAAENKRRVVFTLPEWSRQYCTITNDWVSGVALDDESTVLPQYWNTVFDKDNVSIIAFFGVDVQSGTFTGDLAIWAQEMIETVSETVNDNGEECYIDNPLITTDEQVQAVIDNVKTAYGRREVYTAQWAQDWDIELGDIIYLDTQFETDVKCVVTGLRFSYPGLWGEITLRRID